MLITAIIPAHNEEENIGAAIQSIKNHVDKIIVANDNSTDNTETVSKNAGADIVFNTTDNSGRKAGAINQALERYVDLSIPESYVLVMDADTKLVDPEAWFTKAKSLVYPNREKMPRKLANTSWIKQRIQKTFNRKKYIEEHQGYAYDCVGSIFISDGEKEIENNLEMNQHLEWKAYQTKVEHSQEVFVLTGTCSLISAEILNKVYLKNNEEFYYSEKAITEDFEFTVSAREVGARMISPMECLCYTETMNTVENLIRQRRRWYMGALDLLMKRKLNPITMTYLGQQLMLSLSVFAYMLYIVISLALYGTNAVLFNPIWFVIFLIFQFKNVIDIWKYANRFEKLYAAAMLPGLVYNFLLQVSYIAAIWAIITRKKVYWNGSRTHE